MAGMIENGKDSKGGDDTQDLQLKRNAKAAARVYLGRVTMFIVMTIKESREKEPISFCS